MDQVSLPVSVDIVMSELRHRAHRPTSHASDNEEGCVGCFCARLLLRVGLLESLDDLPEDPSNFVLAVRPVRDVGPAHFVDADPRGHRLDLKALMGPEAYDAEVDAQAAIAKSTRGPSVGQMLWRRLRRPGASDKP